MAQTHWKIQGKLTANFICLLEKAATPQRARKRKLHTIIAKALTHHDCLNPSNQIGREVTGINHEKIHDLDESKNTKGY